ncbi:T9SS type A sorting domain-containing protein [Natronogracilivirgula saccharolytica]|uniref:T9SS type A sorting domain-containing protein n=2 Tax=Natronogracilivirga saccharolytica TaxID=2812953 RepID=A0A8J7RM64_9BACT|nr:T9SS type A sorting domain-containing protein [Natronogracilivirga saccharolytica]
MYRGEADPINNKKMHHNSGDLPKVGKLHKNYPNPFNPTTLISYDLPETSNVRLEVYDLLGRKVATLVNDQMEAGSHEVLFDATNLASGIYIFRITTSQFTKTRQMTLVK